MKSRVCSLRRRVVLGMAALLAAPGLWVLAEAPTAPAVAERPLSAVESRLLDRVRYLASDEMEGRGVGTQGLVRAGEYIRDEFEKAGLDVSRVERGAFQKFSMVTGSELGSPNMLQFTLPDGKTLDLKLNQDFATCSFGGAGEFEGEVVFVGYAYDDKELEFHEFDGVDVKGKVVVIMRRNPLQGDPHSPFSTGHGRISRGADLRTKVSNAVNRGATAVLFVNDPYSTREAARLRRAEKAKKAKAAGKTAANDEPAGAAESGAAESGATKSTAAEDEKAAGVVVEAADDALMAFGYGGRGNDQSLPIMHVRQKAIDEVLAATFKTSLADLEAAIDKDQKPQSALLKGVTVKGVTSLKRVSADIRNVIGVLEGEGPLAEETIIVGAHYDHVGLGGEGSLAPGSKDVHNGADDNASGTATLIEVARRLAARKEKLPRRVVFIAFTAEELGLIGSARYVKEPLFPLERTVAMFNMDMVGRLKDDKLIVYGTGTSSRWPDLVDELGKAGNFKLSLVPDGFGPSDHSSFYAKKIPVLHLFTGNHNDYHRPTDDWQKVNADGMARVADMVEQLVLRTAETGERPDYLEVKKKTTAAREGSRPYFGSIPDLGNDQPGYAITGVAPGSPAEKGGLKGGDVIVALGDNKITSLDDFDLALRKFKPGEEVPVVVERAGKKVSLKVTLAQPR